MTKRRIYWVLGLGVAGLVFYLSVRYPELLSLDVRLGGEHVGLFKRAFMVLLLSGGFCLFRVYKGPTAPDRIVAIDILGILIVGLCALLAISTGKSWYIDIGIAWALQSFISTLALSKYLEGKDFDD